MINLRRAQDRRHERYGKRDVWATFDGRIPGGRLSGGFGTLSSLLEGRLPPSAALRRRVSDTSEVVTYVAEGMLTYEDALGASGVVCAGEFQCRVQGRRARMTQTNASRTEGAHVFQLGLGPSWNKPSSFFEQKRFGVGDRRNGLCVVASPDGRNGSVHLHQDTLVYSALLEAGQHRFHELLPGRGAWLHLVQGEVTLANLLLSTGDGAGITSEPYVSLTARKTSEILLLDVALPPRRRRPSNDGGG